MGEWKVEHRRGTAADFHEFVPPPGRALWVVDLTEPALVLGSTQSAASIDAETASRLGVTVARRHSGGGAVWLHPGQSVWVDITIPSDDSLWVDDVPSSMGWLGEVFVNALAGVQETVVHRAAYEPTELARTVCFGGLAPGEVVASGGKLVGISQRRTREGARFQCVAYTTWSTEPWVDVIADASIRNEARTLRVAELAVNTDQFVDRLLNSLPR
jgi:lipoate-protein ligase A